MAFEALFEKYDRLVLFDTETTGLQYNRDEIIEFAAVVVERRDGKPTMPIAKGNLYKGPFHTPRMLMHVDEVLGRLIASE